MTAYKETRILAIETSCDETAVSIVSGRTEDTGAFHFTTHAHDVHSQIDIHKEYGGVFPRLAQRAHARNSIPLLVHTLEHAAETLPTTHPLELTDEHKARLQTILTREPDVYDALIEHWDRLTPPHLDALAVTYGPGLEPALWVGINTARALSYIWNLPLIPVNHMEGHIASVLSDHTLVPEHDFPSLALLVSGGHTELDIIHQWGTYETVGHTRDDAIGEAFDKVARILGLPYPGGPEISRRAHEHRTAYPNHIPTWNLPRPMIDSPDFDFSFSGIKTAVLYRVRDHGTLSEDDIFTLAREFEDAVVDVLVTKTTRALDAHGAASLICAGGVAANTYLRERLAQCAESYALPLYMPTRALSTDNATMIAYAAYIMHTTRTTPYDICPDIRADGNASLNTTSPHPET